MAIVKSFKSKIPPVVEDTAFGALWNGSKRVSTKNALYDLLTSLSVEDISGFQEEVEDIIGALVISDETIIPVYDDLEETLLLSVSGRMPIRTVTDHAALNIEDFTLLVDSSASGKNTTVTLPTAAAAAGKIYHIVNTGDIR